MNILFERGYRVDTLSLGDNVGLFSGANPPAAINTASFPIGSFYWQTDGTVWKRRGMGPSDWVRMVSEDSALFTGAVASITTSKLALNRALVSNGSGNVAVSTVTAAELGYLGGVTSPIQAQLNSIAAGGMGQNIKSVDYTLILSDAGKQILHPAADNYHRTFTIPANSSVPFPIGTILWFVNEANIVTVAINTDTLYLAGTKKTDERRLYDNSIASAFKITPTKWIIFGDGLK